MNIPVTRPKAALVVEARRVLGLNREKFGDLLRSSKRTVARWEGGESSISSTDLLELARHVYPLDAKLAEEVALAGGATLEALGVVSAPVAPPPPPPPPPIPGQVLVEAIVCAVADALKAVPESVRPAVLAAFTRARELRMTVEDVERALARN